MGGGLGADDAFPESDRFLVGVERTEEHPLRVRGQCCMTIIFFQQVTSMLLP